MQLKGKVAIVTGGGSGIGRAIGVGLAGEGASVVVADIDSNSADAVAAELEELGSYALAATVDVSKSDQVDALVEAAVERFGRLDILINNAGRAARGFVSEMPDEAWDSVISVNLRGTFLCSRAALQHMIPQRSGRIINTASGLGIRGSPGGAVYGASKAAIINFTKSLAQEVARYGITVNAIAPGVTDTPLWRGFRSDADIVEALESGRVGAPEDFVPLVIFLCSEAGGIHCGIMVDRDIYVSRGER
ncbi:MAG: SDR family oxidoreductase [Chloroflexi bacterium]|jgi:3-oxoacyl-[acyl-carrier protein] reductase|nr:MAG: SDR family oxidoreductase [Chloroflexota bacterium]TMG09831.1 MAG: SDR family oxidoreductase [Chloroflexota bacterium]